MQFVSTNFIFLVYILHFVSCAFMCGLIWIVQVVHYPSFNFIGHEKYPEFAAFHCRRISIVVIPAMILELITGILLIVFLEAYDVALFVSFIALVLIWLSTFLIQTPLHTKLCKQKDQKVIHTLIRTNIIRSLLWTIRVACLLAYLLMNLSELSKTTH